ncbi:uncharacterized protein P174DRAFT_382236 [Aspergillus novofumigatus IBT 16806]|uniref:Uncharacterized protein n=1 Tax=Aspergillus novofumigatus (strain IBT 16806) TaxID=1392255 RepID=A0A2I1CLV4_ASPN1|nr:uncharacterized protein P174DRAFT_382236 [Aspergillus novofumigatus IBT 16806]PKX98594.1 hypothetical protein P174DRAFT_382236 [Aspergillus novofumigatus IBT 16806]
MEKETAVSPAARVIGALKDRKLPINRNEVESALFDNYKNVENIQWVEEHLGPDTLLSQEELTLLTTLENSGALQNIISDPDLAATRPFLDEDLRSAIDSLKTSTSAIQARTKILNSQFEILNRQSGLQEQRRIRQQRDIERLHQKHESGRQHIAASSSDLARELEASLKTEVERVTNDGRKTLSVLAVRVKDDDKILADLEQSASGIQVTTDDASITKRASELGSLLAEYVADEIHCRLDRLYLESVKAGRADTVDRATETEEEALMTLGDELESLYPEIDILAEMSTRQLFNEPILRELQNVHGQLRMASHKRLENVGGLLILDTIVGMTSSIGSLGELLQSRESYCATLEALTAAYRTEIGNQFSEKPSSRRDTLSMRRRSTPLLSIPTAPEKRMDSSDFQAIAGVLRRIGLSVESVFQLEEQGGKDDCGENALFDKKQHIVEYLRNISVGAKLPLVAGLIPSDQASQLLASALSEHSRFKTSLLDVEQDQKLSELESQLGGLQKGIERLNLDVLYQRDRGQEKFMEKWA